jgi:hypothetical protein
MLSINSNYIHKQSQSQSQSQSYFTTGGLPPISSSWPQAPWGLWPYIFFSTEPLRSNSLCNTLSDEKMGLSLMNRFCLSSSVHIAHTTCYWKFFLLHYIQVLCQCRLCKADYACLITCYNGSLDTWTVLSLTTAKFVPLIFSMSGFTLSYTANMFILLILYDFCLLPAQYFCIIIYIWKVENRVQIANRCPPWKISNCAENIVLHALQI